jgi:hypothetical protein
MNRRLIFSIIIFSIILIASVFYILTETDTSDYSINKENALNSADHQLADLHHPDKKIQSVFDSDMWKAGVNENSQTESDESESDILQKPEVKDPYTEEQYKAFDLLRTSLPENSVIPKRMTLEERLAEENRKNELNALAGMIQNREATPDQINKYYSNSIKEVKDRIEFLEFASKTQGKETQGKDSPLSQSMNYLQERIRLLEESRSKALEKAPVAK